MSTCSALTARRWEPSDCIFELWAQEPPGVSELAAGEDAAACVLLDRVRGQVKQRGDVGDGQDILTSYRHNT